jgi:hypothetical protein
VIETSLGTVGPSLSDPAVAEYRRRDTVRSMKRPAESSCAARETRRSDFTHDIDVNVGQKPERK